MGVTKSGPEHALMDRLWARALNQPVAGRLPMPDDGLWMPTNALRGGDDKRPNHYSLNQDWCRVSNWLLDAATIAGMDERLAVDRAHGLHAVQAKWGHWCSGEGGKTEFGTGSHRQLYYAAMAGELWAAKLLGDGRLLDEVTQAWRLETALAGTCSFIDNTGWHALYPGARDGKPEKPSAINPSMDELMVELLDGWERPPRTPKVGSYSAAIPLLKQAFAAGVDPRTLIGDEGDLARIPARLGWHLKGGAPNDYYAWFDDLGFCYDPLFGAGYINGEIVLKWTQEEATSFGESLEL